MKELPQLIKNLDLSTKLPAPEVRRTVSTPEVASSELPMAEAEQVQIDQFDESIKEKENTLSNLGKFTQERIYSGDTDAEAEIYQKESHRLDLQNEYDEAAYDRAGTGLKLKRNLSLGILGRGQSYQSKDRGLLDKRVLSPGVSQTDEHELAEKEQAEFITLLKSKGLSDAEIAGMTMVKKYEQAKGLIVKTVERDRTERETQAAAVKLLYADLDRLEKNDGKELADDKASLAKHAKGIDEVEELKKTSPNTDWQVIEQKLADEAQVMTEKVDGKSGELEEKLQVYRKPFEDRQAVIEAQLSAFTEMATELGSKELEFKNQIKTFETNIIKAGKLELLGDAKADILASFEEQKAQARVHFQAFKQQHEVVQARLQALKRDKQETDKVLEKINSMGKTKQELLAAKASKTAEVEKAKPANKPDAQPEVQDEAAEDEPWGGETMDPLEDDATEAATEAVISTKTIGSKLKKPNQEAGVAKAKPEEVLPVVAAEKKEAVKIKIPAGELLKKIFEGKKGEVRIASRTVEETKKLEAIFTNPVGTEFDEARIIEEAEIRKGINKYLAEKNIKGKGAQSRLDSLLNKLKGVEV